MRTRLPKLSAALSLVAVGLALSPSAAAKGIEVALDFIDVSRAPDFYVYVDYLNEAGRPIRGLEEKDVTILIDGERWDDDFFVTPFAKSDEGVAFAILASNYRGFVSAVDAQRKGLSEFITGMRARDVASLYRYDEAVHPMVDFTSDKEELKAALRQIPPPEKPVNVFLDAVIAALEAFPQQDPAFPRRRGIVMMADALDQNLADKRGIMQRLKNDLAPKAKALGVKFYALGYSIESKEGLRIMKSLEKKFGGSFREVRDSELQRSGQFFRDILDRVHGQYIFTFNTDDLDPEETHTLQININHQGKPIESTPVEFQPPPVEGTAWWKILLIIFGALAGVGLIVGLIVLIASRGGKEEEEDEEWEDEGRCCPMCGMTLHPTAKTCDPCLQSPHDAQLKVEGGDWDGFIYPVRGDSVTIGSRQGEIMVSDASVSGKHAAIHIDGMKFELEDLNSTNGTFVNDKRVNRQFLRVGDNLRFGGVQMKFSLP